MPEQRSVQSAVDQLAAELACSVLIEEPDHAPLWWSAQAPADEVRRRTILERSVAPEAVAMARRLRLARARGPVRTPELPEIGMQERWCLPLWAGRDLLGYLWVVDPDRRVGEDQLALLEECGEVAIAELVRTRGSTQDTARRRDAAIDRLLRGRDEEAAREWMELDHLPHDAVLVVRSPAGRRGWSLPDDMSVEVWKGTGSPATSGLPLPLVDLGEAVRRASCVRRAIAAGARLRRPSWDALGAWRLVVDAPSTLSPGDIHPGIDVLTARPRPDLLTTARVVLDHGGDVAAAAAELLVHRTTLYYRLDRIEDLIGVDLRTGEDRTELHLALWLDAYRRAAPTTPH